MISKPTNPSWQEGILIVMRAFRGIPVDFETWNINQWNQIVDLAKKIIEAEMKRI